MFRKKSRLIPIFMFLWYGLLFSQEKMDLTLERSVAIAFENNPDLRMAEKELKKSRAAVWEAYSSILPSVSGNASFQHFWDIQETTIPNFLKFMLGPMADMIPELGMMPDFVRISFGLENTFIYGVSLTQPLFLGGAGVTGIKIAMSAQRAARQNLEGMRQNLIYQTSSAFYGCLLAQELVRVQDQALRQAQANADVVEKKFNAGSASGFDKMRADVSVANLKPPLISARNNLQLAITQLRNVLGLEQSVQLEVIGTLEYSEDTFGDQSLSDLQSIALRERPEISALYEQKYISAKGITLARSQFMPKLFFQTDYSQMAMRNDYKFARGDFSKGFSSAVALQIPLFTGFKNVKSYQKAKLDYRIMLDSEKKIKDGIFAQVEVAYNKCQETEETYIAASESVKMAEEALRLANLMYEEGASTQLDVLESQLALLRAQLNYISSVFEYQMARYEMRMATGTLAGIL